MLSSLISVEQKALLKRTGLYRAFLAVEIPTVAFFRKLWYHVHRPVLLVWLNLLGRNQVFSLGNRQYHYLYRWYNYTPYCERSIEIPIGWQAVQDRPRGRILEIGNVMAHYYRDNHLVLDKYEHASKVINQDIADYHPAEKFNLIVSLSTLEHVGWDEEDKNPNKIITVLEHLEGLLAPGGTLLFTIPLGYNPHLDEHLRRGRLAHIQWRFMKRFGLLGQWREVQYQEVKDARYSSPYDYANAIAIGQIWRLPDSR